ncbi:transposon TX1 uncharacterized 149 kDa protein [Tanacetum coccineum]
MVDRRSLWRLLRNHEVGMEGLWILAGDWNDILNIEERLGQYCVDASMRDFQSFVNNCNLVDIPMSGANFTWSNGQSNLSMSRLDRFLISSDWVSQFNQTRQWCVNVSFSDHHAVVMGFTLLEKFKNVRGGLKAKFGKRFNSIVDDIKTKENRLFQVEVLRQSNDNTELWKEFISLKYEIKSLRRKEASNALQKSRVKWLKLGDCNSKFFHILYSNRIRPNSINAIRIKGEGPFFRPLRGAFKSISLLDSDRLEAPFLESEIKAAVWGCRGDRAPSPDDCTLIANEVIHSLKKSKNGGLILKVDFEKDYDTIEWTFLDMVFEEMNFGFKWRKWIRFCLSSATTAVLVNSSPTEFFSMKRGLRQGDPLSPFLFNIVSEGLNVLLTKAKEVGLFLPVDVGRAKSLLISHLQFADDTLIFCGASKENLLNVKRVLRCFQLSAGLKINFSKSMVYGVGIDDSLVCVRGDNLGCSVGLIPFRYLGLPVGANHIFKLVWDPVIESFRDRLSKWKTKFISRAGRVVLLKLILNSLPLYFMSLFQVPVCVMEEIEKIRRSFFWEKDPGKRKLCIMD